MARNALTLIVLAVMATPALAAGSHLAGRQGGGEGGSGGGGGFLGFIVFVAFVLVVGALVTFTRAANSQYSSEQAHRERMQRWLQTDEGKRVSKANAEYRARREGKRD